jgi:hypothetical protein
MHVCIVGPNLLAKILRVLLVSCQQNCHSGFTSHYSLSWCYTEWFFTTIRIATGCQSNLAQLHLHCETSWKIVQCNISFRSNFQKYLVYPEMPKAFGRLPRCHIRHIVLFLSPLPPRQEIRPSPLLDSEIAIQRVAVLLTKKLCLILSLFHINGPTQLPRCFIICKYSIVIRKYSIVMF